METPITGVEMEERAVLVARYRFRVHLDDLRAQDPRSDTERLADDAPDAITAHDDTREQNPCVRADDGPAPWIVAHVLNAHPVTNLDAARYRNLGEGMVELDASNDPSDATGCRDFFGLGTPKGDAVHRHARYVHSHSESEQKSVSSGPEGSCARLVPRVACLL
jgi:hypothetical protein